MAFGIEAVAAARTQALNDAVATAELAPSIHNTQPWQWRLHADTLDLGIDRVRLLDVTDADNRLAILSCGAALHHALVSLAADGWQVTVTRTPGPGPAGHLATMRAGGRIPIEPAAVARLRATGLRHTDRRPTPGARIDADKVRSIAAAAEAQGASLRVLGPRHAFDLARAADRALRTETVDVAQQAELQHWVAGVRPPDSRLPATVIPHGITPTTVVPRNFGDSGAMMIAEAHDRTAIFAILYGRADRPLDWLRAGEALSAAWLTATRLDVSVLPLSAATEVAVAREILRHLLDDVGYPFLLLRFSVLQPSAHRAPRAPRLSTAVAVEQTDE